jgi:hypothetical protein
VRLEEDTIWLTQDQLAVLFGVERPGITQHIKNIFTEGELNESSVSKKFLRTAADGKNYETKHYNLDMIISLGYRVNSKIATQFRIWATKRLNEYIRKGFTTSSLMQMASGANAPIVPQRRWTDRFEVDTQSWHTKNKLYSHGIG